MEFLRLIKKDKKSQKGQLLIELVLAIGLAAVLLPAIFTGIIVSREGKVQQEFRLEAVGYMKEAEEAVRIVREAGWSNVEVNGIYHPAINGSTWSLASGSQLVDSKFTRQINIQDGYRNAGGALINSPAPSDIIDPSTKRVDITISWNITYPSSITNTIYLTRHQNISYMHTTQGDFELGDVTGTIISLTTGSTIPDDGEVTLGAGGSGDWCFPNDSILEQLDYPGQGEARALTAIEGGVFAGTGQNASGLPFGHISISNTNPPAASLVGTFEQVSPSKSNDVFGEENYSYIATDSNSREIIIIDLTVSPYNEVGYFNPSGNNRGIGVFVSDNIGYMTTSTGNTFRTFDLSSKSGSRNQLGQVTLAGVGNSIYLRGNYAYVAINSSTTQLQIIDVSNPNNPQIVSSLSLSNTSGRDVYVNDLGTRAYVATAYSATYPEFFIVDTTNKNAPAVIQGGTYDTGLMSPTGLRVVPGGRALIVGESGGERYQVISIGDENTLLRCGGLSVSYDIYGIDAILEEDGDAYSYIVTADANNEFKIIEGGPGGQYSDFGTYESPPFDALAQSAFNYINASVIQPTDTSITMQVAVANAINESCSDSTYLFIGPDGTSSSYFTSSGGTVRGIIPYISTGDYVNPGRCFKYKAFFESSESFSSPIFRDVLINYSP